jgi:hypothetical protein
MVKAAARAARFLGQAALAPVTGKGNRVGIADPIAIVLRMAATPSVVASG